jgi:hypothetical protein
MRALLLFVTAFTSLSLQSASAREAAAVSPPVEVMVVGVYHMSNPGHDLHNMKADDVLEPKRQAEVAALTDGLARFKPTKIGVEWPTNLVTERYPKFLAGALEPSRNEVVQLGFRLAKVAGSEGAYSLDADGDFPYERLKNFADAHGLSGLLSKENAVLQNSVDEQAHILAEKGVSAELRFLNDPTRLKDDNAFYRALLHVGAGGDQPGADLVASWYHRNLLICANLVQLS